MRQVFFLLTIFGVVLCQRAQAELIVATETAIASGVLDGHTFTNEKVTLSGTFDTTMVLYNGIFATAHATTTVTVGGISDTLTFPFFAASEVFSTPGRAVGFTVAGDGSDVLDILTSANTGYILQGAFGPFSGDTLIQAGKQFTTTNGYFELDSAAATGTMNFTSNSSTVPEPGSLSLACLGIAGVAARVNRKRFTERMNMSI